VKGREWVQEQAKTQAPSANSAEFHSGGLRTRFANEELTGERPLEKGEMYRKIKMQ